MAEGDEKKSTVIIVKKKGGHAGAHGGAWKIAYADLVTAMMSFFLLMWLLSNVPRNTLKGVADYFNQPSVFDVSGAIVPGPENPKPIDRKDKGQQTKRNEEVAIEIPPQPKPGEQSKGFTTIGKLTPKEFKEKLEKQIEEQLADIKNQIKVEITEDGVRIQLVDKDGKDMFQSGSTQPTAICKRALAFLAESFRELPNPVAVEGHTDSVGRNDGAAGNWALSTKRALAARDMLEETGVDANQFDRVTGKADVDPLVPDDPENSQNRRVAITLLFEKSRHQRPNLGPLDEAEPEGEGPEGGGAEPEKGGAAEPEKGGGHH